MIERPTALELILKMKQLIVNISLPNYLWDYAKVEDVPNQRVCDYSFIPIPYSITQRGIAFVKMDFTCNWT